LTAVPCPSLDLIVKLPPRRFTRCSIADNPRHNSGCGGAQPPLRARIRDAKPLALGIAVGITTRVGHHHC
jgi:hypothetical protein